MSIITLTTDFGDADHYVAAMKGVILSVNPQATIVDITHAVPPQDIRAGAFALRGAVPYFPHGTVHVVVVDPGVGSERRPIALQWRDHFFVGPDNGVLTQALHPFPFLERLARPSILREQTGEILFAAVHLTRRRYQRPDVSHTFHGRDIFAPVAAHLSKGVPITELGEPISDMVVMKFPRIQEKDDELIGQIIHIDRFGNLITNILEWRVANAQPHITIGGKHIEGVRQTYAAAARGELLALIGSSGYLEIAVRDGSAAQVLGTKIGDEVRIKM